MRAEGFVVHIHTLNLRPNRDVMCCRSKALSRRGRGRNGGRGKQIEPFTRQYLSLTVNASRDLCYGCRSTTLLATQKNQCVRTGVGVGVGGDVSTAFSDIQTSQKGKI